jgi:ABC-2 type transport system permease protein
MKKIFEVARWEYVEKIRTKTFLVSVIITPIIIILYAILPTLFVEEQSDSTKILGVLDSTNVIFHDFNKELSSYTLNNHQPAYLLIDLKKNNQSLSNMINEADDKVKSNRIYGYFLISKLPNNILSIDFRSKNVLEAKDKIRFEISINNLRWQQQLRLKNINPSTIDFSKNNISFIETQINNNSGSPSDFISVFYRSIIYIILLTMLIIYSGQMLVRSLLEEKSNRLIEILISSCKAEELLTGKIIGLSALALTQMLLWIFIGIVLLGTNVIPITSFHNIIEIIIYFILGFLFYSSLLVGIGSIVSTEQEAQQITNYLSMILIIPIVIILPAMQNPDSIFMTVLTYFPLTLPSVMILKLNITNISNFEFLTTVLIMFFSILVIIKISTKIFMIGILYYDKMPGFKELKSRIFTK